MGKEGDNKFLYNPVTAMLNFKPAPSSVPVPAILI